MPNFAPWVCPCGHMAERTRHKPRVTPSGRILGSDAARALGRFNPTGPTGYQAATAPAAPIRPTRAAAEADELAHLDART